MSQLRPSLIRQDYDLSLRQNVANIKPLKVTDQFFVDMSILAKKRLRWHRHMNAFFGLKTDFYQKGANLGRSVQGTLPTDQPILEILIALRLSNF